MPTATALPSAIPTPRPGADPRHRQRPVLRAWHPCRRRRPHRRRGGHHQEDPLRPVRVQGRAGRGVPLPARRPVGRLPHRPPRAPRTGARRATRRGRRGRPRGATAWAGPRVRLRQRLRRDRRHRPPGQRRDPRGQALHARALRAPRRRGRDRRPRTVGAQVHLLYEGAIVMRTAGGFDGGVRRGTGRDDPAARGPGSRRGAATRGSPPAARRSPRAGSPGPGARRATPGRCRWRR